MGYELEAAVLLDMARRGERKAMAEDAARSMTKLILHLRAAGHDEDADALTRAHDQWCKEAARRLG